MSLIYNKTEWKDDKSTPINAHNLNNIEDGIEYIYHKWDRIIEDATTGDHAAELIDARYGLNDTEQHPTLGHRLNHMDNKFKEINLQLAQKANIVNIEQYKHLATGNDYSNAFKYIMDNIIDNINYFTIRLEDSKEYIINAEINKRFVTLTGNSTIKGLITIGSEDIINSPFYYDTFMHVKVEGIHFIGEGGYANYHKNTNYGIRLINCRCVEIKNCHFSIMSKPIEFLRREVFKSQHIARIKIIDCVFNVCSHILYSDTYLLDDIPFDELYEIGDVEFNNNTCHNVKSDSILLGNVDGFTCFNNIFFHDEISSTIITINWSCGVFISQNKLFEPGKSTIKINRGEDICITSNHIYGGGRLDKSPSIDIYGVSLYGSAETNLVIANNILRNCYGNGIDIKGLGSNGARNFTINSNIIQLLDTTYEPVTLDGYCVGSVITGNSSNKPIRTETGNYKVLIANNVTSSAVADNYKNGVTNTYFYNGEEEIKLIYTTDSIIRDTYGGKIINISSDVKFYDGLKLTIYSQYGYTTIANNDLIQTKDGLDLKINEDCIAQFVYINDKFRQV